MEAKPCFVDVFDARADVEWVVVLLGLLVGIEGFAVTEAHCPSPFLRRGRAPGRCAVEVRPGLIVSAAVSVVMWVSSLSEAARAGLAA